MAARGTYNYCKGCGEEVTYTDPNKLCDSCTSEIQTEEEELKHLDDDLDDPLDFLDTRPEDDDEPEQDVDDDPWPWDDDPL
jgi:hypothetical protein